MATQPGDLSGSSNRRRVIFPPDEWWSPRINQKYITVLRRVYEAFGIDPSPLYRLEVSLGRASQAPGNLLGHIIAAQGFAAQDVLNTHASREEVSQGGVHSSHALLHQQQDWQEPVLNARSSTLHAQLPMTSNAELPSRFAGLTMSSRRADNVPDPPGTNAGHDDHAGRDNMHRSRANSQAALSRRQADTHFEQQPMAMAALTASDWYRQQPICHGRHDSPASSPERGVHQDADPPPHTAPSEFHHAGGDTLHASPSEHENFDIDAPVASPTELEHTDAYHQGSSDGSFENGNEPEENSSPSPDSYSDPDGFSDDGSVSDFE